MQALPARIASPCVSTTSINLVAGVFSRNREKSLAAAKELGILEDRVYPDYGTMADAEARREDGVDAVVIVTPTDSHYKIAKKVLEAGLNVICDKPLCLSVAEARELKTLAEKGRIDCLPDA